jgi:ATP-binding cassette subfamily B protein
VDLVVRPGEHIALVGHNGSGKTTLVKLLCRLYDVTFGAITIDGVDLREMDAADLRREISIVFQDYARYNLTARENVAFGDAWSRPDDERLRAAARHAGADELIAGLPRSYDTVLGHLFSHGVELSIGEWQKIALARAFLRDAPIIVFDEPTSALDARAEFEVFSQLHRLSAGRAAILISHRLSTVRMADRIYVLEEGRIVEAGDHAELVGRGGTYAELFETQARYYR